MKIHILGICGTFMAGIALIAKQAGFEVTGSDQHVYPPMSTLLNTHGIEILEGYDPKRLDPEPDIVIIGNAMKRGNAAVEYVLNRKIPYISGPQWLAEHVLHDRWVIAVAGTHGKTTTTSMIAWILESVGLNPGFLIGGQPNNFNESARLGDSPFFVIEADEYDTAFFDKRSKFLHYRPSTAILNNLEFDHADIFADLNAIQQQFHFLVRTIPSNGLIIHPTTDANLDNVLERGCWTPKQTLGLALGDWSVVDMKPDGSLFTVCHKQKPIGTVTWSMLGEHNVLNGLAAIAAAHHAGVKIIDAINALNTFSGVKRRLEIRGTVNDITVYDDFAHHPTAIKTTLNGLRKKVGSEKIHAILEFASNTMKTGVHGDTVIDALNEADQIYCLKPESDGQLQSILEKANQQITLFDNVDEIVIQVAEQTKPNEHVLVMSNKSFAGIHEKLLAAL